MDGLLAYQMADMKVKLITVVARHVNVHGHIKSNINILKLGVFPPYRLPTSRVVLESYFLYVRSSCL